jgi:hypothetical protein
MSRGSRRRTKGGRRHVQTEPASTPVLVVPRMALPYLRPVRRTPSGSLLLPTLTAAVLGRGPVVALPKSQVVIALFAEAAWQHLIRRIETAPGLNSQDRQGLIEDLQARAVTCTRRAGLITLPPTLLALLGRGALEARSQRGRTDVMLATRRTMRSHGAMRRDWTGEPRRIRRRTHPGSQPLPLQP